MQINKEMYFTSLFLPYSNLRYAVWYFIQSSTPNQNISQWSVQHITWYSTEVRIQLTLPFKYGKFTWTIPTQRPPGNYKNWKSILKYVSFFNTALNGHTGTQQWQFPIYARMRKIRWIFGFQKAENWLTTWMTISFTRSILPHGAPFIDYLLLWGKYNSHRSSVPIPLQPGSPGG